MQEKSLFRGDKRKEGGETLKKNITNRKNKKESAKRDTVISITVLVLAFIGILVAMLYNGGVFNHLSPGDRKINMETGKVVKDIADFDASITENANVSYPGYEKLIFKAGRKKQDVYLHNPKENTCYFQICLILEDGTTIWQSDYLEPGNAFDRIELTQSLQKGNYENATLQYDSYSIKDGHKLNGSSINLTLEVE